MAIIIDKNKTKVSVLWAAFCVMLVWKVSMLKISLHCYYINCYTAYIKYNYFPSSYGSAHPDSIDSVYPPLRTYTASLYLTRVTRQPKNCSDYFDSLIEYFWSHWFIKPFIKDIYCQPLSNKSYKTAKELLRLLTNVFNLSKWCSTRNISHISTNQNCSFTESVPSSWVHFLFCFLYETCRGKHVHVLHNNNHRIHDGYLQHKKRDQNT